ncbi:MAG TPA: lipid A deacylase LpxR family protein [Puia sp.]|nr:lipid A deacylase LpxR family protein [Puia sp.]
MKKVLRFLLLWTLLPFLEVNNTYAQRTEDALNEPARLFRVYWDDDYFNYTGKGTDQAYTDGTRFELFYTKRRPSRFFVDRAMPKAGDSSVNIYGWGLVQLMLTPNHIARPDFQPNDYPWSGALFATHTLFSYNQRKKYDVQTEIDLGVTGPASLAGQTQDFVHQLIHYQRPKGWNNQFGNGFVLNINFAAEKQFMSYHQFIEVIGGAQVFAGTAMNGMNAFSLVRIGKMEPYFNGFMKQYSSSAHRNKVQFYFVFKPQVNWMLSSALVQGGINSSTPEEIINKNGVAVTERYHPMSHIIYTFAFGPVLVMGHFTISSLQTSSSAWMKGLYDQTFGNVSLYYSW